VKTTLIACTLNEIEAVQVVLPQIDKRWVDEIIIADGGSTDGTVEYCRQHGYFVMQQKGRGYGGGIQEAVQIAKGDIIIEFPPDGNSLPAKIPEVIAEIHKGYDFVIVSRYKDNARSDDDDFMTAIGNKMFTALTNVLFGTAYTDVLVGYRAYRKAVFQRLRMTTPGLSWPAQEAIQFARQGARVGEIPGNEPPRIGGQRKMRIFKTGWEILMVIKQEYVDMRRQRRKG
jgi:glycosyltransferase involved in cell wall biosynthesis